MVLGSLEVGNVRVVDRLKGLMQGGRETRAVADQGQVDACAGAQLEEAFGAAGGQAVGAQGGQASDWLGCHPCGGGFPGGLPARPEGKQPGSSGGLPKAARRSWASAVSLVVPGPGCRVIRPDGGWCAARAAWVWAASSWGSMTSVRPGTPAVSRGEGGIGGLSPYGAEGVMKSRPCPPM